MSKEKKETNFERDIHPYLVTALAAIVAMVLFVLLWTLFGRTSSRLSANEDYEEKMVIQYVTPPESDDGSQRAGICEMSEDMSSVSSDVGKHRNSNGSWYSPSAGNCYYNGWVTLDGNRYHFDSDGYIDTGWTAIAGSGYYFDDDGVYDPDANPSMMIAVTFDDGPSVYTSEILDILEEYNCQATFMMVGEMVELHGEVISRMIELGCTIGNHTYDHSYLNDSAVSTVLEEFESTDKLIESFCGRTSSVVRFPGGSYTKDLVKAVGKPHILWDVDTRDWESRDSKSIQKVFWDNVESGSIVLMHDIYETTLDAVKILIPELVEKGYKLVTIEELAASRGYELEDGVTYFSFKDENVAEGRVNDR